MYKNLNFLKIISIVTEPKLTYFFLLGFFALKYDSIGLIILFIVYFIIAVVTLTLIKKKQENDDYELKDKFQVFNRVMTYIFTIVIVLIFMLFYRANDQLIKEQNTLVFMLVVSIFFLIVTFFKFKLSAHIAYTGIIIFYVANSLQIFYGIFVLCSILIGYSRIKLKKHTVTQVILAFLFTLVVITIIASLDGLI